MHVRELFQKNIQTQFEEKRRKTRSLKVQNIGENIQNMGISGKRSSVRMIDSGYRKLLTN